MIESTKQMLEKNCSVGFLQAVQRRDAAALRRAAHGGMVHSVPSNEDSDKVQSTRTTSDCARVVARTTERLASVCVTQSQRRAYTRTCRAQERRLGLRLCCAGRKVGVLGWMDWRRLILFALRGARDELAHEALGRRARCSIACGSVAPSFALSLTLR